MFSVASTDRAELVETNQMFPVTTTRVIPGAEAAAVLGGRKQISMSFRKKCAGPLASLVGLRLTFVLRFRRVGKGAAPKAKRARKAKAADSNEVEAEAVESKKGANTTRHLALLMRCGAVLVDREA